MHNKVQPVFVQEIPIKCPLGLYSQPADDVHNNYDLCLMLALLVQSVHLAQHIKKFFLLVVVTGMVSNALFGFEVQ